MDESYSSEKDALGMILDVLSRVDPTARLRLIKAAEAFVGDIQPIRVNSGGRISLPTRVNYSFTEDRTPSISSFARLKKPQTDVERVTLVAYYRAYYRKMQDTSLPDMVEMYKESGLPPIRNISDAMRHAEQGGYLTRVGAGRKITPLGREVVEALPDRSHVTQVLRSHRKTN